MAQRDDQDGGDWFTQNAPSSGPLKATAADVALMYRNLLGREASADEIQSQLTGGSYDLNTIQGSIASSPEASAYQQSHPTGRQTAAPTAASGGDDALRQFVLAGFSAKGIQPRDDNDLQYWMRRVTETGGLDKPGNADYWKGHMAQSQGGVGDYLERPEAKAAPDINFASGGFTDAPSPYASNANAPSPYEPAVWTGGPPPSAPTLSRYTAPTQAELEASPGYQSRLKAVQQVRERSAAAQGSILNGGTQVALGRDAQNFASNEYGNLIGQGLAITNTNNNAAQTEFGDSFAGYQSRYGQFTDANAYGQQGYTNKNNAYLADNARTLTDYLTNTATQRNAKNDYWAHLNDLYQAGLGAANNSYKPGVTL